MAGERTLPGLGLTGFWDLGSAYKPGMDSNLLAMSVLVQLRVKSRVTALPGSPADGDVYIVPSGAGTNANEIAVRDNGAWAYFMPAEGYVAYVEDEDAVVRWAGAFWTAAGGATPVPEKTASATLALADAGAIVEMNVGVANVLTIPANATVAFPIGTVISVSQIGAGATTIAAAAGVTLNGVVAGSGEMSGQWSGVSLYKRASDVWVAQGGVGVVA